VIALRSTLLTLTVCLLAGLASADTLDNLTTLTSGQLLFDSFSLDGASGEFAGVTGADIDVTLSTGPNGATLLFAGAAGDLTLPAGAISGTLDISYRVRIAPGSEADYDLGVARAALGNTTTDPDASMVSVGADLTNPSAVELGGLGLSAGMLGDNTAAIAYFPSDEDIAIVSTRITLISTDLTTGATLSSYSHTYSAREAQPVPEPAAMSLLAMGSLAMLRRRRSRQGS
jgi:hypothetical protein